ncbi:MAG: hypothetical protein V3U43_08085 [Pseudomonadales bacterium]
MKAAWIALLVLPLLTVTTTAKVLPEPAINDVEDSRNEFLDAPGFMHRWRAMLALDRRHLYRLAETDTTDQRLRIFAADLAANEAQMVRARQAGNLISSDGHERVVSETLRTISASGDGSRETPFASLSEVEAMRYMALTGRTTVATALVVTRLGDPLLAVWSKDDAAGQPWYFSLKSVYRRMRRAFAYTSPNRNVTGYHFLVHMAEKGSPAALVGRAATILAADEPERSGEITEWLHTAARASNALAIVLLGDMERKQAPDSEPSRHREQLAKALAHYAQASDLGYGPAAQRAQEVKAELAALTTPAMEVAVSATMSLGLQK